MFPQNKPHTHLTRFAQEKVSLSHAESQRYRQQIKNLKEQLEAKLRNDTAFQCHKVIHSGSVAKGTALKSLNDMDIAVHLTASQDSAEPAHVLKWLRTRLREIYPGKVPTEIFTPEKGHCVVINFQGSGLDVDVVPVIVTSPDSKDGFLVQKSTGNYLKTSISKHLDFIKERNTRHKGHFSQVVRLVKFWIKRQKTIKKDSFRFKSFMAEMILAHLSDRGVKFDDYSIALEQFFHYIAQSRLQERIHFTDYYPAGSLPPRTNAAIEILGPVNEKNNIAVGYSEADRIQIVDTAKTALNSVKSARSASLRQIATIYWQQLFGSEYS